MGSPSTPLRRKKSVSVWYPKGLDMTDGNIALLAGNPKNPDYMPLRTAVVLDRTDVTRKLRPLRHIKILQQAGYSVDVLGFKPTKQIPKNVTYRTIPNDSLGRLPSNSAEIWATIKNLVAGINLFGGFGSRWYSAGIRRELKNVPRLPYDVALVEDLYLLPAVLKLGFARTVILDEREHYPSNYENSLLWRLLRRPAIMSIYKKSLPLCDSVFTVSPMIARDIEERIVSPVGFFPNVPEDISTQVSRDGPGSVVQVVYHGLVDSAREIHNYPRSFEGLKNCRLTLVPVGSLWHRAILNSKARAVSNVNVEKAVDPSEIDMMLTRFDVGLAFFPARNFSLRASLPNKFFEYALAGLPAIVAPNTAMSELVESSGFGFVAPSNSAFGLRELLENLSPGIVTEQMPKRHSLMNFMQETSSFHSFCRATGLDSL